MDGDTEQSRSAVPPDLEKRVRELIDRYVTPGQSEPVKDAEHREDTIPAADAETNIDFSAVKDTLLAFDTGIG